VNRFSRLSREDLSFDPLLDAGFDSNEVLKTSCAARNLRATQVRQAGVRVTVPGDANQLAGALGAEFLPDQTGQLLIIVLTSDLQGIEPPDAPVAAMPQSYALSVLRGARTVDELSALGAGVLRFDRALLSPEWSSPNLFRWMASVVIRLLIPDLQQLPEDEFFALLGVGQSAVRTPETEGSQPHAGVQDVIWLDDVPMQPDQASADILPVGKLSPEEALRIGGGGEFTLADLLTSIYEDTSQQEMDRSSDSNASRGNISCQQSVETIIQDRGLVTSATTVGSNDSKQEQALLNLWQSTEFQSQPVLAVKKQLASLPQRFGDILKSNSALLLNAGSIIGTRAITSGLGFVYWWLAARMFVPQVVGLASAAISAMMLLGTIGVLGLGTLLIGELRRRPDDAGSLVVTALLVSGSASTLLGGLFILLAPYILPDLAPLTENVLSVMVFVVGVALTSVVLVLDQALIGILRGHVQLWRNGIFAVSKLGALALVGLLLTDNLDLLIYATWALGNTISFVYVAGLGLSKAKLTSFLPHWKWLRELRGRALEHYSLNLSLQVPGFTLPLVVTAVLSAEVNASFYVTWMIATSLFVVPLSLTTTLYAVGAANPSLLSEKTRFTIKLSLACGLAGVIILIFGARPILDFFGRSYAEQATASLRVLALGIFPVIVKAHFVAISQIHGRMLNASGVMALGAILELTFAAVGAYYGGLTGLSIGWVLAISIEALLCKQTILRVITSGGLSSSSTRDAAQPYHHQTL
jgi:O-antigen/teichoic acid export membrane protein